MKRIISNIAIFLLVAAIGAFFVSMAMGISPYITRSGSMEPAIQTGSVCFVDTRVAFESIVEGDIIAYELSTGDHVTHRAITVTDDAIETKGDANDVSDGFSTTKDNFIGKTICSIPYLGYVVGYMQQPVGKIMIGVVILAIIAFGIIDHIEEKQKRKEEELNM